MFQSTLTATSQVWTWKDDSRNIVDSILFFTGESVATLNRHSKACTVQYIAPVVVETHVSFCCNSPTISGPNFKHDEFSLNTLSIGNHVLVLSLKLQILLPSRQSQLKRLWIVTSLGILLSQYSKMLNWMIIISPQGRYKCLFWDTPDQILDSSSSIER